MQTTYKEGNTTLVLTTCKYCDMEFSGRGLYCYDCSIWHKIYTFLKRYYIPCSTCNGYIEKKTITLKRYRHNLSCDECCGKLLDEDIVEGIIE